MGRPILEREQELAALAEAAREASRGRGSVVLLYGEAGIGKSSLVEAVRGRLPAEGRMLVGHCDDLTTARTLGPLRDVVGDVGTELAGALRDGSDRDRVLTAFRNELDWAGHPTVLAVEDVHWADDATLDVLRYLARRIGDLPAVLLLTWRDDELGHDHPLHQVLGALAGNERTRRLPLGRLSPDAVRSLSATVGLDGDAVYAATSGNPFFVSEVIGSDTEEVPRTVMDAVSARVRRLDPVDRAAVEQLAVVPSAIERWLVEALVVGGLPGLVAAEEHGIVVVHPRRVTFRHELTRRAVVDALPRARRTQLQERVLAALLDHPGVDPARVVHHAAEAEATRALVSHAPTAARDAAANGAHREAAAHFRLLIEHAEHFSARARAEHLEGHAEQCYTLGERGLAVESQTRAVALRRELGDPAALGAGLRWLSRMRWWNGQRTDAEEAAVEAVEVLERVGDPRLLALAHSNQAQLDMLAHRSGAVASGERAVAMAREAGDAAILSHALNNLGSARWRRGDPAGRDLLQESLRVALAVGEVDHVCRAYTNLAWQHLDAYRPDLAEPFLVEGAAYADRAEHVGFWVYLHIGLGRRELARGAWERAYALAGVAATDPVYSGPALAVQGLARSRSGAPDATALLHRAFEAGLRIGEPQWLVPAAAALVEDGWMRGDPDVVALAGPVLEGLRDSSDGSLWVELAYWLQRAGGAPVVPPPVDGPYALLTLGRWREAADVWALGGCVWEQALALSASPRTADLLTALELLDSVGATPLAGRVRRRLREIGAGPVPRGPVTETRRDPAGLTARQSEVLRLLADGHTNAQIADTLVISVRTADNHVAAILEKLGVHSRSDAVARAHDLGIPRPRSG